MAGSCNLESQTARNEAASSTRSTGNGFPTADNSQVFAHIGSMDMLDNRRRLEPGDSISFRIVEESDQPLTLMITPTGEVGVPYLGLVRASGLTCKQFASSVQADLEKKYYNHATVIVGLEAPSALPLGVIYVVGQVGTQGPVEIPHNERFTVSKAILRAGGFSDFADKRRVRIVRSHGEGAKTERITVDVKAVLEQGKLEKDVVLQPGDFIVVPERMINF